MGVTPTAAATRRMVTASAPPLSSRSRAAAAIRDAVVWAITYTVYIKISLRCIWRSESRDFRGVRQVKVDTRSELSRLVTIRKLGISVRRTVILANLQLLHRRKIRRSHVHHVYFFHKFAGLFGVLSDQLLKIWVGSHSIPVLFRFLPAGMSNEENEGVVPSGRLLGHPVAHNLQIVLGE